MFNSFMNNLKDYGNTTRTTNGAVAKKSTGSAVYDMFVTGGAYRNRTDEDVILQFKNAFEENPILALKCLFYLRDIRGGQGERRYFRVAYKWLAENYPKTAEKLMSYIPEYGRWDDVIKIFDSTKLENKMYDMVCKQFRMDMATYYPSLLMKWMPSCNTSSKDTKQLARKLRNALGMTEKEYRKALSEGREKLRVVERLMSANRWNEIEFDKLPSKAGLIYKNAFARRDLIADKYKEFAEDKNTKVNADTLYPYEIVKKALGVYDKKLDNTDRLMVNKYWDSLPNYFEDNDKANMICVVDTSGSMIWSAKVRPIDVAISLGIYCAQHLRGAFANHYISFSSKPQLIETKGVDFVDMVKRIYKTNLCDNTNLEAVFDLLLDIAKLPTTNKEDIPTDIVVISDMQIDEATGHSRLSSRNTPYWTIDNSVTEMEKIKAKWAKYGIKCPRIVYWNVNAIGDANIIDRGEDVSFVSGFSPIIMKQVLSGKTGYDLMLQTLMSDRYAVIE